tara:strand:- start:151 stop:459 length:309 start_codon:yes stop_codon:yes gene_type:complete
MESLGNLVWILGGGTLFFALSWWYAARKAKKAKKKLNKLLSKQEETRKNGYESYELDDIANNIRNQEKIIYDYESNYPGVGVHIGCSWFMLLLLFIYLLIFE